MAKNQSDSNDRLEAAGFDYVVRQNSSFETVNGAVLDLIGDILINGEPPGSGGGGGITTEQAVDAVAAQLVAGNNIDITYDDAGNTITFDVEALTSADVTVDPGFWGSPITVESALQFAVGEINTHIADTTDAHDASAISFSPTGGIAATDVQTAIAELDTEKATTASLAGYQPVDSDLTDLIARWRPADSSLSARLEFAEDTDNGSNVATITAPSSLGANITVGLPSSTGTLALQSAVDLKQDIATLAETIRDTIATALVAGTNITITPNDGSDTITIDASGGGGGITTEDAVDAVAAALVAGNNIDITYNDVGNTITIDVESLTSSDVGLGNVNNTSDANKPISTATQTALDGKQPLDSDLTTIAGLTATTDSFLQAKASAWTTRTVAQVKTDLGLTGTNSGDQTSIVGITGTIAQFNTAVTDADLATAAQLASHESDTTAIHGIADTAALATLTGAQTLTNKTLGTGTVLPVHIIAAISDETTALTTGVGKLTLHMPYAFTVTSVYAEVNTVSSSGVVTVDINEGAGAGTTILSTKLTIDTSEETSGTAAAAAVISDSAIAANARITFDIDTAGTGAKGLKVHILGTRTL